MTDWQPGDLALCVKGGSQKPYNPRRPPRDGFPVTGALYTVVDFKSEDFYLSPNEPALWFTNAPRNTSGDRVWSASRFVKVTPGADIEGVEVERKVPKPVKKSEGVVT